MRPVWTPSTVRSVTVDSARDEPGALHRGARPAEVVNGAPVDVLDLAYDTRAVRRHALLLRARARAPTGTISRRSCRAGGAVALVVERPLDVALPQLVVPDVRAAMARRGGDASSATRRASSRSPPSPARTGRRRPRSSSTRSSRRPGARPGLLTNIERRVGGASAARPALNTPEAIDLQRLFRADARRRRHARA